MVISHDGNVLNVLINHMLNHYRQNHTMNIEKTYEQLKEMNLSRMAEALHDRLKNGDHIDLSHEQFIALLIEDEYVTRKQRRLQRMIAQARFKPELPSLEDIVYNAARGFEKKSIMQFSTLQWIENAHNIILTGPTGSGKSFLAQAIALQACRLGVPALNIRYNILFLKKLMLRKKKEKSQLI